MKYNNQLGSIDDPRVDKNNRTDLNHFSIVLDLEDERKHTIIR